jgi:hypothetical protein
LELFDQLYWTADQLQLRQLASIIWALGRLQLVAVPQELLERLLTFVRMQQQQQLAASGKDVTDTSSSSSSSSDTTLTTTNASRSSRSSTSAAAAQYQLSKQIYKLLLGLAGLRNQLPRSMLQQAGVGPSWIMAVIAADGPLSHVHVPACLHAAAVLRMRLPADRPTVAGVGTAEACAAAEPAGAAGAAAAAAAAAAAELVVSDALELSSPQQQQQQQQQRHISYQAAVLSRLSSLRPRLSHTGLALGLWGAVVLGCRPDSAWLKPWLSESERLLAVATASEINMLLHACVLVRYVPAGTWMRGVYVRLRELLVQSSSSSSSSSAAAVGLSGSSMVATLRFLVALQKLQQQQQQQQWQWQQHMTMHTQQQQQAAHMGLHTEQQQDSSQYEPPQEIPQHEQQQQQQQAHMGLHTEQQGEPPQQQQQQQEQQKQQQQLCQETGQPGPSLVQQQQQQPQQQCMAMRIEQQVLEWSQDEQPQQQQWQQVPQEEPSQDEQQQQQQQLRLLLGQMSLRMERLEIGRLTSATAVRQFQEYASMLRH